MPNKLLYLKMKRNGMKWRDNQQMIIYTPNFIPNTAWIFVWKLVCDCRCRGTSSFVREVKRKLSHFPDKKNISLLTTAWNWYCFWSLRYWHMCTFWFVSNSIISFILQPIQYEISSFFREIFYATFDVWVFFK